MNKYNEYGKRHGYWEINHRTGHSESGEYFNDNRIGVWYQVINGLINRKTSYIDGLVESTHGYDYDDTLCPTTITYSLHRYLCIHYEEII